MAKLYDLAMEYHRRCEAYDRTVCSDRRGGVAVPSTSEQSRLVNDNAIRIRREIAQREFIDEGDLRQAIKDTVREFERVLNNPAPPAADEEDRT